MTTSEAEAPKVNKPRRFRLASRRAFLRLTILFTGLAAFTLFAIARQLNMPGSPHTGPLPTLTDSQASTAERLRAHVEFLAAETPDRHVYNPAQYAKAATYITAHLTEAGLTPTHHTFETVSALPSTNITAEIPGTHTPTQFIILGAHYDTYPDTPGADDNASGVAALIELAARFADNPQPQTIRLVFFANEEPPHFRTEDMGSHRHAEAAHEADEHITAMLSLEMLGYYSDAPNSQQYPPPLNAYYPSTGNFIAVVGNLSSTKLVRDIVGAWRETTPFPCYGAALPAGVSGVDFSDHRSFWAQGYRAAMITDTANFRNPRYHTSSDRPATLDYERMARVVDGIEAVTTKLATAD